MDQWTKVLVNSWQSNNLGFESAMFFYLGYLFFTISWQTCLCTKYVCKFTCLFCNIFWGYHASSIWDIHKSSLPPQTKTKCIYKRHPYDLMHRYGHVKLLMEEILQHLGILSHYLHRWWIYNIILLIEELLHYLHSFSTIPGGWPWDFWTINSMELTTQTTRDHQFHQASSPGETWVFK